MRILLESIKEEYPEIGMDYPHTAFCEDESERDLVSNLISAMTDDPEPFITISNLTNFSWFEEFILNRREAKAAPVSREETIMLHHMTKADFYEKREGMYVKLNDKEVDNWVK